MKKEKQAPERHPKGWGYEDWIANNNLYCGKLLFFNKGKKCSIHYHKDKHETFFLQSGKMQILLSDSLEDYEKGKTTTILLEKGDSLEIWSGRVHQMLALEDSELFEFSTHHEEEDSYRIVKGD
jgi:mannose-6-phosphate isomerase-like protein (cupin superfamily)